MQPTEIIDHYYRSLYSGDLEGVKGLMTKESYLMTLESYGLRLSLENPEFKLLLKEIEESEVALKKVESLLSEELASRDKMPTIKIINTVMNGSSRQTVNYTQDGKPKKLYFSKEDDNWQINYFAGRKVGN